MESSDGKVISLEEAMDISKAHQLKEDLQQLLKDDGNVIVDLSEVERIDTAVMQLLVAFARAAKVAEISVEWKSAPSSFTHAVELLDIKDYFDIAV